MMQVSNLPDIHHVPGKTKEEIYDPGLYNLPRHLLRRTLVRPVINDQ